MKISKDELSTWLNERHFRMLDDIRSEGCGWPASRIPKNWAERVDAAASVRDMLPTATHDRETLKAFCAEPSNVPEACFAAVMAWGGMKYGHGRSIWEHRSAWRGIVARLRDNNLSRAESYDAFRRFRAENPRCGMGPAYYTKLIFFCRPGHDGYIMDQWTSLAVNLLFSARNTPVVDMTTTVFKRTRSDTVSDRNTAENYEIFCQCVEYLAERLGVEKPADVEEWLFSKGGRPPAPWRRYVKEHRPSFQPGPPRKRRMK